MSLLQEALHREQMLEQKLATLQRLLASTQEASESSWQVKASSLTALKHCAELLIANMTLLQGVLRLFIVLEVELDVIYYCLMFYYNFFLLFWSYEYISNSNHRQLNHFMNDLLNRCSKPAIQ